MTRAVGISRCIAQILLLAEEVLEGPSDESPQPDKRVDSITESEFLKLTAGPWYEELATRYFERESRKGSDPSGNVDRRVARLILLHWRSGAKGTRPDVLNLVCELMANPDLPYTYKIVRFSIALAMRSLYGILYSNEDLRGLRGAYQSLRAQARWRNFTSVSTNDKFTRFLTDLLCLEGCLVRRVFVESSEHHYQSYLSQPLGIDVSETLPRHVQPVRLCGSFPEFGTLLNLAFAQPTGIPGFDDIMGGFIASIPEPIETNLLSGGLVTLISGPPGSGKTSFCLTLSSRMAEMGSVVRYIGTEESKQNLEAKLTALSNPLGRSLLLGAAVGHGDFSILNGSEFSDFGSIRDRLTSELAPFRRADERADQVEISPENIPIYLIFPRVVVIDSLSALSALGARRSGSGVTSPARARWLRRSEIRKGLSEILTDLRHLGVCVFLVGGTDAGKDEDLAYLVDNVIQLSFDASAAHRHPVRIVNVEKTRLQSSSRGQHVFHISDHGCYVSPSLESVLSAVEAREMKLPNDNLRAVLWADPTEQLDVFPEDIRLEPRQQQSPILSLRANSHVLVYGRGASGKARLGIALAFEPRISIEPRQEFSDYVRSLQAPNREATPAERSYLNRAKVLVISFHNREGYYRELAQRAIAARFHLRRPNPSPHLRVLEFHPGMLDPETVVATLRRELRHGDLSGSPYTAVLIDGIQNQLIQFPLLAQEPLLWPTVYQMLRTRRVETITTFSFFRIAEVRASRNPRTGSQYQFSIWSEPATTGSAARGQALNDQSLSTAENVLYHLLISSCDYSFVMERTHETGGGPIPNAVPIQLVTTVSGIRGPVPELVWDPIAFRFRSAPPGSVG